MGDRRQRTRAAATKTLLTLAHIPSVGAAALVRAIRQSQRETLSKTEAAREEAADLALVNGERERPMTAFGAAGGQGSFNQEDEWAAAGGAPHALMSTGWMELLHQVTRALRLRIVYTVTDACTVAGTP